MPALPLSAFKFNNGPRARGLLALFILLVGLVAGVAVSQTEAAGSAGRHFSGVVVPSMKRVHELVAAVDEVRGLSALHLLQREGTERTVLEARLAAERRLIDKRMLAYGQRLVDDTDRQHFEAVQKSLASFWSAQDRLLAAARRAPADPAAAAEARTLMSGESQAAFRQLTTDLEAWWTYVERLAEQASASARQQALALLLPTLLAVVIAALLGMAAGGLLARPRPGGRGQAEDFASTLSELHGGLANDQNDDHAAPASRTAMLSALESARQRDAQPQPGKARRYPDAADTRPG